MTRPSFADLFNSKPIKKEETVNLDQLDLGQLDQDQGQQATKPLSNLDTEKLSYSSLDTQELSLSVAKLPNSLDTEKLSHSNTKPLSNQVKGYFLPNWIQDELLPTLELAEQAALLRIVRLTFGFNKQITDSVGLSKLAEKCNLSQSGIKKALKSLENRGLIKIHSDLSRNAKGGNKYEILIDSYGTKKLSHSVAKSPSSYKKDLDLDLKITDPHQSETMKIYQNLTGNTWTKSDSTNYTKIKHLSIEQIDSLIRNTLTKAQQKPNSLAYFIKAHQTPTTTNPNQHNAIKHKLTAIIQNLQELNIGRNYKIADLLEDTKRVCIRDRVPFDNDLFNDALEKKKI